MRAGGVRTGCFCAGLLLLIAPQGCGQTTDAVGTTLGFWRKRCGRRGQRGRTRGEPRRARGRRRKRGGDRLQARRDGAGTTQAQGGLASNAGAAGSDVAEPSCSFSRVLTVEDQSSSVDHFLRSDWGFIADSRPNNFQPSWLLIPESGARQQRVALEFARQRARVRGGSVVGVAE